MMKKLFVAVLCAGLMAAYAGAAEKKELKDQKEKNSYSLGANIGNSFKRQSLDLDPDAVAQGMKDALSGTKLLLSEKEIQETLARFQKEMMEKQAAQAKKSSESNRKEGEAFLAANKKKEGVKALPSGLQYKVIKAGSGKKPNDKDTVMVHYRGTLINGTEFDSSYKRGEPVTFPVKGVIPGWTEALQLMKTGSKWQLFIPSKLAYGEQGSGPDIGPNSTLIFDVELISIK